MRTLSAAILFLQLLVQRIGKRVVICHAPPLEGGVRCGLVLTLIEVAASWWLLRFFAVGVSTRVPSRGNSRGCSQHRRSC